MSNNIPDLEFLVGVNIGEDVDAVIRQLKVKAGSSFEVVKRYQNPIFLGKASEDGFYAMTGVRPTYTDGDGWSFDHTKVDTGIKEVGYVLQDPRGEPA